MAWAYIGGMILAIAGIAIIINKKAGTAALVAGIIILVYSFFCRHLPSFFGNSWEGILWSINAWKTLALAGGGFIVAASFCQEGGDRGYTFISNNTLILTGTVFVSIFFIIGGFSHFKYADFVIGFIPAYIPFHAFWTYFCGIALMAGGIGIHIKPMRRLAALLSGYMVLGWFILLHIPRFIAAPHDASDRMGLFESLAISGIMFVLANLFSKDKQSPAAF